MTFNGFPCRYHSRMFFPRYIFAHDADAHIMEWMPTLWGGERPDLNKRSLWRSLCLHSATTATIEPPWQSSCLHSASFAPPVVPLQQLWWFKERTRVVLQQLHRNRTFWLWATTERSGRSKVVRRPQPCVKGALMIYIEMIICIWFWSSITNTVPYIEHQLYMHQDLLLVYPVLSVHDDHVVLGLTDCVNRSRIRCQRCVMICTFLNRGPIFSL